MPALSKSLLRGSFVAIELLKRASIEKLGFGIRNEKPPDYGRSGGILIQKYRKER